MDMEKYYKVLIDTNFFFLPFYENFDVINELRRFLEENGILEYKFFTLEKNIKEIENLLNKAKSNKWKKIYNLVSEYIKRNDIDIIKSDINERTDRLIVKYSIEEKNVIVCTQDRTLRYILRKLRIPVIFYSHKSLHILW